MPYTFPPPPVDQMTKASEVIITGYLTGAIGVRATKQQAMVAAGQAAAATASKARMRLAQEVENDQTEVRINGK